MSYKTIVVTSVEMGTNATSAAVVIGDVVVKLRCGLKTVPCKLKDVLRILSFEYSLLPVRKMYEKGLKAIFKNSGCEISYAVEKFVTNRFSKSLYILDSDIFTKKPSVSSHLASLHIWHERLAHFCKDVISYMVKKHFC